MPDSNVSATAAMLAGSAAPNSKAASSSSTAPLIQEFSGTRFDIPYKILVPALPEDRPTLERLIHTAFDDCDVIFNPYNPLSELSTINDLPQGVPYPLSDPMTDVLHWTNVLHSLSGGRFDPTVGPLVKLWHDALLVGGSPDPDAIEAVGVAIGWETLTVRGGFITKSHDDTRLDLGGIAKGWCVDTMIHVFQEYGYRHAYVDFGGDVRACGWHPDKREWSAAIVTPPNINAKLDPNNTLKTVELPECAMATSGDYMRLLPEGYCHIFDPLLRCPLKVAEKTIASASVQCRTCIVADGLATVLCILGQEDPYKCEPWLKSLHEADVGYLNHYWYSRGLPADEALAPLSTVCPVSGGVLVHGPPVPSRSLVAADAISNSLRGLLRLVPHMVAVVTAVPHTVSDAASEELSNGQRHSFSSANLSFILQACEASNISNILRTTHVATYSSVVPMFHGSGAIGDAFLSNVLKPSRMHSLLTEGKVTTCCLHFLHLSDASIAMEFAHQAGGLRGREARYCDIHHTVLIESLSKAAYHCQVTMVQECGDHILVMANILAHGDDVPLHQLSPAANEPDDEETSSVSSTGTSADNGWSPLIYCMGSYYSLRPQKTVDNTTDWAVGDFCAAVVVTKEKQPTTAAMHFTACSLVPPMVSFVVQHDPTKSGCPLDGRVRVHLPRCTMHEKVQQMKETAGNPWLTMYSTLGHGAVLKRDTNGTLDCHIEMTIPVPTKSPKQWIVVGNVVAANLSAAELPLACLAEHPCDMVNAGPQ